MVFEIHTDGGSRGNPGPAASAFLVEKEGNLIFEESKYLGTATNNFAEYTALIMALEWICKYKNNYDMTSLIFFLDSELVVKQVKRIYKVKDPKIKELYLKVVEKLNSLKLTYDFRHVPRALNKEADALVNKELDFQIT